MIFLLVVFVAVVGSAGAASTPLAKVLAEARRRANYKLLAATTHRLRALLQRADQLGVELELGGRQVELRQAEALAHLIANVTGEEECEALEAQVSVAVLGALDRVYLRIGVEVAHALDVHYEELVVGALEREVTERLGRQAQMLVVAVDEARVGVVLGVLTVDEVLEVEDRRVGAVLELENGHLEHVDLLGRVVTVEDLGPEFCVHLEFGLFKVTLARYGRIKVAFGHVV